MKLAYLKSHWSPEEAYSMLMLLDELRDTIWNNYRDEIIELCHAQNTNERSPCTDIVDDQIPF